MNLRILKSLLKRHWDHFSHLQRVDWIKIDRADSMPLCNVAFSLFVRISRKIALHTIYWRFEIQFGVQSTAVAHQCSCPLFYSLPSHGVSQKAFFDKLNSVVSHKFIQICEACGRPILPPIVDFKVNQYARERSTYVGNYNELYDTPVLIDPWVMYRRIAMSNIFSIATVTIWRICELTVA